ncbi:unnamed protein product, partial [marine sediment metagenome]
DPFSRGLYRDPPKEVQSDSKKTSPQRGKKSSRGDSS